ncbi:MAG: hypothetical protein K1X79_04075 [Oligoflexia bacterium]|nr:hypothetical protein [Oligoflexia bacterium]
MRQIPQYDLVLGSMARIAPAHFSRNLRRLSCWRKIGALLIVLNLFVRTPIYAQPQSQLFLCADVWSNIPCGKSRPAKPAVGEGTEQHRRQNLSAELSRLAGLLRAETGQDTLSAQSAIDYCAKESTSADACEARVLRVSKDLLSDLKAYRKQQQRARELEQRRNELAFKREKLQAELRARAFRRRKA